MEARMSEKIAVIDDEAKSARFLTGWGAKAVTCIAIMYVFLEVAGLQFIVIDPWIFMALVLILIFILGFLTIPLSEQSKGRVSPLDWLFMAMGVAPCIYIIVDMDRLQWEYGTTVLPRDIFFSILLTLVQINLR
jgi:TRAP-type uncharacterized transport system fused permease subunit